MTINLTVNAANPRLTNIGWILMAASIPRGTKVTRRQKGFSDSNLFDRLDQLKWIEPRRTGPRGGVTWHATAKGRRHLRKALRKTHAALADFATMFKSMPRSHEENDDDHQSDD